MDARQQPTAPDPEVLLLGPGPSPVSYAVRAAQAGPIVGHLDPVFLATMDGVQAALRTVFGAPDHEFTLPLSGTGSAGMEAAFTNAVEPGDRVVVCVNGVFGERMLDVARRQGAEVVEVRVDYGRAVDPQAVRDAVAAAPTKLVGFVHAETSTGVLQDPSGIAAAARAGDALILMDCVTSLSGVPVDVQRHGIDIAYAGTQKCLSVPPGLAPFTLSANARERIRARSAKPPSWYLDAELLAGYWEGTAGTPRAYHHTAPVTMVAALAEGLRAVLAEGLVAREARHRDIAQRFYRGLEALRLEPMVVDEALRTPMLTSVSVPEGVDEAALRRHLRTAHAIEIGGGFGPLAGRIWRVGLMGEGARPASLARLLPALADALTRQGHACSATEALQAAGV